jgi:iron complex outermembrane recepter protein
VNANLPINQSATRFLYAFGGYSRRDSSSAGFYRRALDARNLPQVYPQGFLPLIEPTVQDASVAVGVRGVRGLWSYDFSGGFGHNGFAFSVGNSLNVS